MMRFSHRVRQKYRGSTRRSSLVNATTADPDKKDEKVWQQGDKRLAFHMMRQARLHFRSSANLQFEYGARALEEGRHKKARKALQKAVVLDATNLDALELFLEANRSSPAAKGAVTRAITNVAELLPHAPDFDLDAATILLPSMQMVEIIDQKVRMLRYSKDPIAKHIGILAASPCEDWHPVVGASSQAELIARLIIVLARGEYDQGHDLMEKLAPEALPQRALRIAIRKELRNYRHLEARTLLEDYRRANPEDQWARQQLQEVADLSNNLSNQELIRHGFPFPDNSIEPIYTSNNRRVLYLLHSSLPYHSVGYATRTHGLLRGIRGHGWDVQGVTRLGYPYDMHQLDSLGPIAPTVTIDGVPYHRLSTSEGLELKSPIQGYITRYVTAIKELASRQKPFVLHAASNHWNGLAGVTAARELGIPSIYEVRGLWEITRGSRNPAWAGGEMYRYMARLETDAATNADQVITITGALRDELIDRGVDENKIAVVPNGVDVLRFGPRKKNQNLVTRLGLQYKTVIGYVGSILNYEGIGLLLDVAQKLKRERNDVVFLFVGDGAELDQYRARVKAEELSDVVIFTGRVPHEEVEDYYSIIDICPFPRLPLPVCEIVSPLKPFEAMAMGKAVVASNVAALAEIVTHGVNGLLFDKGDSEHLAHALRQLLDDPSLSVRLAESGRRWVTQERDWKKLSEQISTIYTSLGGRPGYARRPKSSFE